MFLKNTVIIFISVIFITLPINQSTKVCWAEFEDTGCGARAIGMGNAYMALAKGASAIYYNPAGLGYLRRQELCAEYGRLWWGLDDDSDLGQGFIGYVHPLRKIKEVEQGKDKESNEREEPKYAYRHLGTIGIAYLNFSLVDYYEESTLFLSYGRRLNRTLWLGLNLKWFSQKIGEDDYTRIDPVFEDGYKKDGYALDIASLYNLSPKVFVGLALFNINQPNMGFNQRSKVPLVVKAGLSYRERYMNLGVDTAYRSGDMKLNLGVERWLYRKILGLRGGLGLGSRQYRNLFVGIGVNFKSGEIDYAFLFPLAGIEETMGCHRVSFTYRFGRPTLDETEPGSLEEEVVVLEQRVKFLARRLREAEESEQEMERILLEKEKERLRMLRERPKKSRVYKKKTAKEPPKVSVKPEFAERESLTYYVTPGANVRSGPSSNYRIIGRLGWGEAVERILEKGGWVNIRFGGGKEGWVSRKLITKYKPQRTEKSPTTKIKSKKGVPEEPGQKIHTVKEGETLSSIAEKYYGNSEDWPRIYEANEEEIYRGRVEPGTILIIP